MRSVVFMLLGCLLSGCHWLLPLGAGPHHDGGLDSAVHDGAIHDGTGEGRVDAAPDGSVSDDGSSPADLEDLPDMTAPPTDMPSVSGTCSGTWQSLSPLPDPGDDLNAIWCAAATTVVAVGDFGLLLQFNGTWIKDTASPAYAFSDAWGSDPSNVLAVGYEMIWRLGGTGWNLDYQTKNSFVTFKSLFGLAANDVYVVGSSSTFLHHNGAKWSSVTSNFPGTDLRAIWGTSSTNLYVVADQGQIIHFDGQNGTVVHTTTSDLKDIWGFGSSDIYAVGTGGTVVHFDGQNWSAMPKATGLGLRAVWGSAPNQVFAVGDSGAAICFDGQSWQPVATPPGTPVLKDVRGCGSSTVFAAGPSATVLAYVP